MSAPLPASDRAVAGRVPAFTVDAAQRLAGARQQASPHFDQRPDAADISLLVIHSISLPPGQFGAGDGGLSYIDALFLGQLDWRAHPSFESLRELRVSAHLCIFRDGAVTQYVPFDRRAWHAGVSAFDGRSRCNDFAIGIELEGCDEQPFSDAQYATLGAVTNALRRRYPAITSARIVGHSDIAPGRKTDPGPHFDWPRLRAALEQEPGA
ncbi:MAG: ampD [Nevskia sp.]|nr:ampD [Nevskia sp.]